VATVGLAFDDWALDGCWSHRWLCFDSSLDATIDGFVLHCSRRLWLSIVGLDDWVDRSSLPALAFDRWFCTSSIVGVDGSVLVDGVVDASRADVALVERWWSSDVLRGSPQSLGLFNHVY
jgi:hypothetical protein